MLKTYDETELIQTRRWYTCLQNHSDELLHTHKFGEMVYQVKGSSKNIVNNHVYTLQTGDVLLMKPNANHQIIFNEDSITRDIYIQKEQFDKICNQFSYEFSKHFNTDEPLFFSLSHSTLSALEDFFLVFNFFPEKSPSLNDLHSAVVSYILSYYIANTFNTKKMIPPWIKDLIRELSSEKYLSMPINEIIHLTNYSYGHVARNFKHYTNLTLKEYVMQVKMEHASSLLLTTYDSIETIAYKIGFQSTAGFIKAFSKIYQFTPHQYRKKFNKRVSEKD